MCYCYIIHDVIVQTKVTRSHRDTVHHRKREKMWIRQNSGGQLGGRGERKQLLDEVSVFMRAQKMTIIVFIYIFIERCCCNSEY